MTSYLKPEPCPCTWSYTGSRMSLYKRPSIASFTSPELNFAPGSPQYQPVFIVPLRPPEIHPASVLGPVPPEEPSMLRILKEPGPTFRRSSVVGYEAP